MPKARDKNGESLLAAVSAGNLSETKHLLTRGHDPDIIKNSRGQTPIFLAAHLGNNDIFNLLLEWKASVSEIRDKSENSILHITNNLDIVKTLLSLGLDINCRNQLGRTPLHNAILKRNFEVAELLIKNGSNVNVKDVDGNTCLHFVSKCYYYLNKYILRNRCGRINLLDALERNMSVPYIKSQMVGGFHIAILEHEQDLFDYICYVNSIMTNIELVEDTDEILSFFKTFSIDKDEHLEILNTHSELLQIGEGLLKSGGDPTLQNCLGEVPLHLAVDGSNIDLITLLCRVAPSTVNVQDNMGKTPLVRCYSLPEGYEEEEGHQQEERQKKEKERKESILRILHAHGADLDLLDINGFGLLYFASHSIDYLQTVMQFNPDVNIRSKTGASILHFMAVETNHLDDNVLELLLGKGLDINARDIYGATPLFFASWCQDHKWVQQLLKHGGHLNAMDHSNYTAADLAMFNNQTEIADFLIAESPREQSNSEISEQQEEETEDQRSTPPSSVAMDLPEDIFVQSLPPVLFIKRSTDVETMFKFNILHGDSSSFISDLLESPATGRTNSDEENLNINQAVLHLITKVGEHVETLDPRFKMRTELSGSVSEGAKCGRADEFDFLCCLVEFEKVFQPEEGKSDPPGFVRVVATNEKSAAFDEFCSRDGYLINAKLVEVFYRLLYHAIHSPKIWESTKALFPSLHYHPELELKGPSVDLTLRWLGKKFKDLFISIDMVPALYFRNWWPFTANDHIEGLGSLHTDGSHVVLTTYQDVTTKEEGFDLQVPRYFRASFSRPERKILNSVSQHVRYGYMLAKTIRDQCQPIHKVFPLVNEELQEVSDDNSEMSYSDDESHSNSSHNEAGLNDATPTTSSFYDATMSEKLSDDEADEVQSNMDEDISEAGSDISRGVAEENIVRASIISTYMLKMALFHEIDRQSCDEDLDAHHTSNEANTPVDSHKACEWAKRIYQRLKKFTEMGTIPSFFIPKFDLMDRYDTSDFYVFDNLVLEDELQKESAKEDKRIIHCPLPEDFSRPVDTLPNSIPELIVELRHLQRQKRQLQNSDHKDFADNINKEGLVWGKLKKVCHREQQLIFIAIILSLLRDCDTGV